MRIVLIGAVTSTDCTLDKLIEHEMDLVGVFGYQVEGPHNVSGHVSLERKALEANVPFHAFKRINDHVEDIRALSPDMIFVVGLSQLVSEEIINIPTHCCVGFHPTVLPAGRGRAPVAWLVLEETEGAANFFRIAQGTDDGPLFVQEKFAIADSDDASDVTNNQLNAMRNALDRWLPAVKRGDLSATDQDESKATYYGRRSPEDGQINWDQPVDNIDRLIKSAAHPHPGAFTYCENKKVVIWKSSIERNANIRGVTGRVLQILPDGSITVQCAAGVLRVDEYEVEDNSRLSVGKKLGYYADLEIYKLQQEIASLKDEVQALKECYRSVMNAKDNT